MSLVTVIWSVAAGACITLALVHILLWCSSRRLTASLWFAGIALSVAATAWIECRISTAREIEEFYALHRWGHVTFFFTFILIVGFVHSYFGTGRPWLIGAIISLRAVILFLAFIPGPTFNFREVTALHPIEFLGDTLMMPEGVATRWENLGNLSGLMLVWFVVDAALRLWRMGNQRERQRAVVVAGGIILFVVSCVINGVLVHHSAVQAPYYITLSFLFIIAAMEIELGRDLLNASKLASELRENAESMSLAGEAGQVALWRWDIPRDSIWVSPGGRQLYGIPSDEPITLNRFLATLHPDDLENTSQIISRSLEASSDFHAEYRVVLPDGKTRWISARGRAEIDPSGQPQLMRGTSIDITERTLAEQEAAEHRSELAYLTRVTTLNELSGSLAHELNQPLAIILSNAQAAQRLLAKSPPDLNEISEILSDIVGEDQRASEVIRELRALFKRGEISSEPVSLNEAITSVLRLAQSELVSRSMSIKCELAAELPLIMGDRIQLQQVILNLVLNASDAMIHNPPSKRQLVVCTEQLDRTIRVSVRDEGRGLPEDHGVMFQPFHTTKSDGLGLGLAISRAIVTAHQGRLWAEENPGGGAIFRFEIPELKSPST